MDFLTAFLVAALLLGVQTGPISAAVSAGQNSVTFEALCRLITLAKSQIVVPPKVSTQAAEPAKLRKLNMSVSDKKWRELFHDKSSPGKYHEKIPEGVPAGPDWQQHWQSWVAAEKALKRRPRTLI
ncbi:Trypanosomal VSG domain containing protein, putative [Trypanosoma equiperdum]|uniref:Trypanosomal VSG domain containing protein, putative n=1 Tax=Trypanosoma equiperdum TaxID=5694 RepID=A0A1G4IHE5_TRYEQ|nr:Trypanosomal VSG domain containing protein, putative [Trypanosoma equiperdum]